MDRMRSTLLLAAWVLLAHAAAAQQPQATETPAAAPNATMLHLSVTATVKVAPDELVAYLDAVATMATPVQAQHAVNDMMAQAKAAAAAVPAVTASFLDYTVGYADEKKTRWAAQQTLELKGGDADALLDLVGRLQSAGLVLDSLDWRISDSKAELARRSAHDAALKALLGDAALAAATLGMQVDHLKDVNLEREIQPFQRRMAARAETPLRLSSSPPVATPAAQDVVATARADVVLRPASGNPR
jgi:uncharacterized protein